MRKTLLVYFMFALSLTSCSMADIVQHECDKWKNGMEAEILKPMHELDEVFYNESSNRCYYALVMEYEDGNNYQVINAMTETNAFNEYGCFLEEPGCRQEQEVKTDFLLFVDSLKQAN